MSSSNEIQPNPKEISSLQETETPASEAKTPLETPNTTPNNINNSSSQTKEGKPRSNSEVKDSSNRGSDSRTIHFQRVQKSQNNLDQIKVFFSELKKVSEFVRLDQLQIQLQRLQKMLDNEKGKVPMPSSKTAGRLPEIHKEIMKFKQQISSLQKLSKKLSQSADLKTSNGSNGHSAVDGLVNVHNTDSFISSSFYNEIDGIFDSLDDRDKFLLSCFAVLPENAVVHRRLLTYWGVGEGVLVVSVDTTDEKNMPEKIVEQILKEFEEKGLIEPVLKKRKLKVKSYKMYPLVRSAMIMLSERSKLFAYDSKGNVVANPSKSNRACLLKKEEESSSEQEQQFQKANSFQYSDLEKLNTLFNVNEPFPDLELALLTKRKDSNTPKKKDPNAAQTNGSNSTKTKDQNAAKMKDPNAAQTNGSNSTKTKDQNAAKMKDPNAVEWLSKMKNAKVVSLGSWPGSAESHVEVENIDFLKALANMKELKFLSLQGIFRITELPSSIGMLSNLLILDLKECHNLEELSEEITKLTNLRYLDLSECYLLAHMPKGLSELSQLQVLKGFVISTSTDENKMGTISDLKGLQKLRKLTINVNSDKFPRQDDLKALKELGEKGVLRKLTIAWSVEKNNRSKTKMPEVIEPEDVIDKLPKQLKMLYLQCFPTKMPKVIKPEDEIDKLPNQLEKLDLECFPNHLSTWLTPKDLPHLEKLYIRGGDLATLDKGKWLKVKSLRLKFLRELKMTWIELKDTFPDLVCLEKVNCPRISLCPCDENGVWMKPDDCDFPEISTRIG
ncbi:rac guanine nucleotide exchange factor JJ-like [Fagus crenata]